MCLPFWSLSVSLNISLDFSWSLLKNLCPVRGCFPVGQNETDPLLPCNTHISYHAFFDRTAKSCKRRDAGSAVCLRKHNSARTVCRINHHICAITFWFNQHCQHRRWSNLSNANLHAKRFIAVKALAIQLITFNAFDQCQTRANVHVEIPIVGHPGQAQVCVDPWNFEALNMTCTM